MTGKCEKKGRISRRHPSLLQLRLQTLGYAHFSCAGVGGEGAGEVLGECVCVCVTVCARGVCTFKINWSDERGALCLAVAPIIYLVMSPVSECVCMCWCAEFQSIK